MRRSITDPQTIVNLIAEEIVRCQEAGIMKGEIRFGGTINFSLHPEGTPGDFRTIIKGDVEVEGE